jgi:DNA-binding IclR family transcriptional regulator
MQEPALQPQKVSMSKLITQREQILNFLRENPRWFSAAELAKRFNTTPTTVGSYLREYDSVEKVRVRAGKTSLYISMWRFRREMP